MGKLCNLHKNYPTQLNIWSVTDLIGDLKQGIISTFFFGVVQDHTYPKRESGGGYPKHHFNDIYAWDSKIYTIQMKYFSFLD